MNQSENSKASSVEAEQGSNMARTDSKIDAQLTHPDSRDVHPVDVELDYLGKVIAHCRSDWPKDKRIGTVQAQLKSWNDGTGNRPVLRQLIPRLIDKITSDPQ
jgi:hypothetical protein